MNKGEMMKLVYSKSELYNIDSAIPMAYWNGVDKSIQVDPAVHVMNYNKPNQMGKLENLEDIAKLRMIDLEKGLDKSTMLARFEGYNTKTELIEEKMFSSVVPGICVNDRCNYTTNVEPDCNDGWCEMCDTNTVESILILEGMV
jgi:hypothetical protein